MGLTLVAMQRLQAQEFPKTYKDEKAHWKHHYDAALDALKKLYEKGTMIRPDDIALILATVLEADPAYKDFAKKLPQKYWIRDVADYIVEQNYKESVLATG